ncbi:hypothetical protein AA0482_1215 [Acetobacter cibinongensis NRIC 0482]|nr:hypothetical protein AA0482_1215 [Acetobacter cibinongensis NRIC 0482]
MPALPPIKPFGRRLDIWCAYVLRHDTWQSLKLAVKGAAQSVNQVGTLPGEVVTGIVWRTTEVTIG